jgi:hypothetical protein
LEKSKSSFLICANGIVDSTFQASIAQMDARVIDAVSSRRQSWRHHPAGTGRPGG